LSCARHLAGVAADRSGICDSESVAGRAAGNKKSAMADHTTKAFDSDLGDLVRMIVEMGGMAEREIAQAVEALTKRNVALAARTIELDEAIDRMQLEIENKAVATIARRQPVAIDLRSIIAILRAANELERIADLAKNIAKRVIALNGSYPNTRPVLGLKHMATLVLRQLHDILDSLAAGDDDKAMRVWSGDEAIDSMYTSLFREVLTYVMEDPGTITFCIHLLFCAKNLERIGDHVTNIAEAVHYMIEGHPIAEERPKRDTTSIIGAPSYG
jgi:phosphate transport system protein